MSIKTEERVGTPDRLIEIAELEIGGIERPNHVKTGIEPAVAGAFGLHTLDQTLPAETKTMRFQGKLFVGGRPEPVAILDDVTVTATRMGNPQTGLPILWLSVSWLATSLGWRTTKDYVHEGGWPSSTLYFKNASGGIVLSWSLQALELDCGADHKFHLETKVESTYVGWFDVWGGIQHLVQGPLFRC